MLNETHLSRIDLNLLVLFAVVLKEQHVGRAADRLHVSPSAVSHGLGRLRRLLHDPLFLKTPKGVVPTGRALQLAEPIADILARVGSVLASAEPFDPAQSTRCFSIGAPDGISAVVLPALLAQLKQAPHVDIRVRQLLPLQGETSPDRAWRNAFAELESRALDIAIIPSDQVPARFDKQPLFKEDFVIAMRAGHAFARKPTLDRYCNSQHLVVSQSGDDFGFIDQALEKQGRQRRVALTVPSFMFALAVLGDTELIAALPRRFAALHAERFGIVTAEAPLPLERFQLYAVASRAAMMDAGVAWLFELLRSGLRDAPAKRRAKRRAS